MRSIDARDYSAALALGFSVAWMACGSHPPANGETGNTPGATTGAGEAAPPTSAAVGGMGAAPAKPSLTGGMPAPNKPTTAGAMAQNMMPSTGGTAGAALPPGDVSPSGGSSAPAAGSGGGDANQGAGGAAGAPSATCTTVIPPSMDCAAKLAPGDERRCTLGSRKYIVHAGKTMSQCDPVGLVIDAHGATETDEQQIGKDKFCSSGDICWAGLGSGWAAESDAPGGGFIAVFPQGNNNMWSASDADFMLKIVDEMKKLANIDPKKVYISGISNGGFLTFQTGCPHSDVFRGMAPNSGGSNCTSVKQPIPLISFDAMPDFAYDGHKTANMSVVTANQCKGSSKPWLTIDSKYDEAVCRSAKQDPMAKLVPCTMAPATMKPTTCVIWDECDGGVKVAWCDVSPNMEHGQSNAALDAHILYENDSLLNTPSVAWRFFKMFW